MVTEIEATYGLIFGLVGESQSGDVTAEEACRVAAERGYQLTPFVQARTIEAIAPGRCAYTLVSLIGLTAEERGAVAWLIARAIMKSRCGADLVNYERWERAVLEGQPLTGNDRRKVVAYTTAVFGSPSGSPPQDHVQGYVAEWIWYSLTLESEPSHRSIALLEPPKFSVTEGGGDGFVVWRSTEDALSFRLWELKKHTGRTPISRTIGKAYKQLSNHGDRYLAQMVGVHSRIPGPVGDLCAELVDLWVEADRRAGVGVGVTSSALPGPTRSFGRMGASFPSFRAPGQLEGLVSTVEGFDALAIDVRRFVCSAL